MKRQTRRIVEVARFLTVVLVSFALPTGLPKPGAAAELKTVTLKVEGWVCYG